MPLVVEVEDIDALVALPVVVDSAPLVGLVELTSAVVNGVEVAVAGASVATEHAEAHEVGAQIAHSAVQSERTPHNS